MVKREHQSDEAFVLELNKITERGMYSGYGFELRNLAPVWFKVSKPVAYYSSQSLYKV